MKRSEPQKGRGKRRTGARRPGSSDGPTAFVRKLAALHRRGKLDEAEVVANAAIERFPKSTEIWHEYAMVAYAREDMAEAARRWQNVASLFPDSVRALSMGAIALREAGRIPEAESLVKTGLARFPDDPDLWNEYALAARDKGDYVEAAQRWQSMRAQLPNHPVGYTHGVAILRELGRLEEAEALCESAMTLFEENPGFWNEWGLIATERHDLNLAAHRWQEMLARFPDFPEAYTRTALILRDLGQEDEADRIINAGVSRFPDDPDVAIQHAWSVYLRTDWQNERPGCWDDVRLRFPDHPQGYSMSCNALMRIGRLDQAEALSEESVKRFPTDLDVLLSRAYCATRRGDWAEAVRRWTELQKLYPDADGVSAGIDVLRMMFQLEKIEQDNLDTHSASLLDPLSPHAAKPVSPVAEVSARRIVEGHLEYPDLFRRFESVGGTCEFGIVQRIGGAHTLGLLRWCTISPRQVIAALESRFEGVGSREHTFLTVNEIGEYILSDRRYFNMHTFIENKQADAETFLQQMCRRLVFLRDKLIEDLENAEKVFVYKPGDGQLEDADLMAIRRAIRQYAANTVLCVRMYDDLHPAGTVERIAEGLLLGYIDRNPTSMDREGVSYDCWSLICRSAFALVDSHLS